MNVQLTPLYFLVSMLLGMGLCVEFVKRETYKRMEYRERKQPFAFWLRIDAIIIALNVVCTSIYFIWCIGGMFASYFGGFYLFSSSLASRLQLDLILVDIIVDSLLKTITVMAICLVSFQVRMIPAVKEPRARIWKKLLFVYAVARFFVPVTIFVLTKEKTPASHLLAYMYSLMESLFIMVLLGVTYVHTLRDRNRAVGDADSITNFLPRKSYGWNLSITRWLFAGIAMEFAAKLVLTLIVIYEIRIFRNSPIAVDLACLLKTASTIVLLHTTYEAKIPFEKPFCMETKFHPFEPHRLPKLPNE